MSFTKKHFLNLVLLFFMAGLSSNAHAQNPDDNISIYNFNEKLLEHLIKEQIDSVRLSHGLKTLYNDSILYVAAKFHANYLYKKGELNHTEPDNPKMETPQKR